MGLLPYKDYQTHVLFPINSVALPGKPQSPAPLFPEWGFVFLNVPFGPLDYHVFDFFIGHLFTLLCGFSGPFISPLIGSHEGSRARASDKIRVCVVFNF